MKSFTGKWLSSDDFLTRNQEKSPRDLSLLDEADSLDGIVPADHVQRPLETYPLGDFRLEVYYDGNSDAPLRGILKKPIIPARTSSLRALHRSRSSENLNPLSSIQEVPSHRRRASSVSLGFRQEGIPEIHINAQELPPPPVSNPLHYKTSNGNTPKFITPLSTPKILPQTFVQPALATPVLVIPENGNPFDFAATLEDGRIRRVSTGSIDPFAEEEEAETYALTMKNTAKNLLSGGTSMSGYKKGGQHVGWKSDFLTVTPVEGNSGGLPEGYERRRSSSLPDLPGASRPLKSVKGRRATPWVHNIGINGNSINNSGTRKVKLAFPTLKRLSDASVKSMESGYEVWYDALEKQAHER
ncbi:hypothetical protein TWF694_000986 [Orbilia ellipsospora]|uniref:Uncharacterized protein n=1 Tax=Orbilia ellipsospora TaxID=2528407 RepID=A0AAV9XQA3_9PEZI